MELSVIIPCYNAAETIAVQLDALAQQEWSGSWEIIFANNNSTDASAQIAMKYKEDQLPQLRIIDASSRQGQPYALNVGAKAAAGSSLAFCDADDEVGAGWVAAMGEALRKYDFVACRMDTKKLNPWLQGQQGHSQEYGLQQIWYPPYLSHAGGGSLGVKHRLFEKVGGFDESLPYLHDTDFCFKLQQLGTELHFVPDALVHIRYRSTLFRVFRQSRNYAEYNVLLSKRYCAGSPEKNSAKWWMIYLADWWKVIRRLPALRNKRNCYWWMWRIGRQIGRLHGSVKYWTPPV